MLWEVVASALCTQAMGMPFSTVAVAECKEEARRFMARSFPEIKHTFPQSEMLIEGSGCLTCSGKCSWARNPPDLVTAGLPCQPVTKMRWKKGPGQNQRSAKQHKLWVVIEIFFEYLAERKPKGFMVEEVLQILSKDEETGVKFLDIIMTKAASLGYGCCAVQLRASVWIELPRDRLGHSSHIQF